MIFKSMKEFEMFFKKKKEEEKKELVIAKRIRKIYEDLQLVHDTGDKGEAHRYTYYDFSVICSSVVTAYSYTLETKLGERSFYVSKDNLKYGIPKYSSCMFSFENPELRWLQEHKFLFSISCSNNICPFPVEFTGEEIDLAILELEEHLRPLVEEAEKKVSNHREVVEYFNATI